MFHRPLAPSSGCVLNLRSVRGSGSQSSYSKQAWQRAELADTGTVVPQNTVLGTWHFPIDSRERVAPRSQGHFERSHFQSNWYNAFVVSS